MPVTIPVVVGGLIALTGGVLGPWMLQGGREKTDARKKKAEKFEELVIALYEYDHWLDTREQHWVYGNEDKVAASPLAKVQAILSVYFSQFANALSEL